MLFFISFLLFKVDAFHKILPLELPTGTEVQEVLLMFREATLLNKPSTILYSEMWDFHGSEDLDHVPLCSDTM
jgi:hypothetical protein